MVHIGRCTKSMHVDDLSTNCTAVFSNVRDLQSPKDVVVPRGRTMELEILR